MGWSSLSTLRETDLPSSDVFGATCEGDEKVRLLLLPSEGSQRHIELLNALEHIHDWTSGNVK